MSSIGLIVRKSERFEISLPARVRVAMNQIEAVQYAKGVTDPDRWINVDVVDFAQGGVGFVTDIFFARAMDLEFEILNFADPGSEALLHGSMQIKRVQMTDRRPAYLIGCAFTSVDDETQQKIDSLLDLLMGECDSEENGGGQHA